MNEKTLTRMLLVIVVLGLLFLIVTDKSLAERFKIGEIQGRTYEAQPAATAPAPAATVVVIERVLVPCTGTESAADCYQAPSNDANPPCNAGQCPDDNK